MPAPSRQKSTGRRIVVSVAIVACAALLIAGVLKFAAPQFLPFGSKSRPSVVVVVTFLGEDPTAVVDKVLAALEKAIDGVPGQHCISFAAKSETAAVIVQFQPEIDPDLAVRSVQERIDAAKDTIPPEAEEFGVTVMKAVKTASIYITASCPIQQQGPEFPYNYLQTNVLPEINKIPRVGPALMLGDRQFVLRIRLNIEQMLRLNVSQDDVVKALSSPHEAVGLEQRVKTAWRSAGMVELCFHSPSQGQKIEQYESIVLKANADGEVIRLKERAQLELGPLYPSFHDRYPSFEGRAGAAIVLLKLPSVKPGPIVQQVKKQIDEFSTNLAPPELKFEVTDQFPVDWCLGGAGDRK